METKILPRRRHSDELKTQVLQECNQPGASVAAVALGHGLNANLVHRWRRLARPGTSLNQPSVQTAFIELPLQRQGQVPAPTCVAAPDIRIELKRGALSLNIAWPVDAATECAAWMRELLR